VIDLRTGRISRLWQEFLQLKVFCLEIAFALVTASHLVIWCPVRSIPYSRCTMPETELFSIGQEPLEW